MPKVVIEVSGGVVQSVWTDLGGLVYTVIDRDEQEEGGEYIWTLQPDGAIPDEIQQEIERGGDSNVQEVQ